MSFLGGFLNLFALPPGVFPLLVQLDNSQRLKVASTLPTVRWPIYIAANLLLGVYFSLAGNNLIVLPIGYHISALMGIACWGQQLEYSQPTNSSFSLTNYVVTRTVAAALLESAVYGLLYLLNNRIVLVCIGAAGVILFAASLILLPYDRNYDLDSPDGGFQPLPLAVEAAAHFISLIVLFLFYRNVDFAGCSFVGSQVLSLLGVIAVHQVLRRAKSSSSSRTYTSIPLQNM